MGISFLNSRNLINNFSSINKINNNPINSISFKGSRQNDEVEFSSNARQIQEIRNKIQAAKNDIADTEAKSEEEKATWDGLKAELIEAEKIYGKDAEETKCIAKKLEKTKNGTGLKRTIGKKQEYLQKLETYLEKTKKSPETAFLYNPDTTIEEKDAKVKETEYIKDFQSLSNELNIPASALTFWNRAGSIDADIAIVNDDSMKAYLNLNKKENAEFLDSVKDKLPSSISGRQLCQDYSITPETMRNYIKKGKLEILGVKDLPDNMGADFEIALFDLNSETNKKFLRGLTYPSRKYFNSIGEQGQFIPAAYLEKLGYGTAALIRENIQAGILPGKIKVTETPQGKKYKTILDVSSYLKTKDFLSIARKINKDVTGIEELSNELGIRQKRIKEAIANGEAEIINEYLIEDDKGKIYLKRSNPKNALFIEKALFEKMIAEELRAKEKEEKQQANIKRLQGMSKENSLRMKLARHMCPNTREIASSLAKQDGYLCKLLIKDSENKEDLTEREEIKVNSYRKQMWSMAGTEELSAGLKKAQEYMNAYYEDGIEAIDDKGIREIIKMYYPN